MLCKFQAANCQSHVTDCLCPCCVETWSGCTFLKAHRAARPDILLLSYCCGKVTLWDGTSIVTMPSMHSKTVMHLCPGRGVYLWRGAGETRTLATCKHFPSVPALRLKDCEIPNFKESIRTSRFSSGISSCPYTFFKKITALRLSANTIPLITHCTVEVIHPTIFIFRLSFL